MLPSALTTNSFRSYPPQARSLATKNLPLIQQLPIIYAALLLREVGGYDWRFPAERRVIDAQFSYLQSLSASQRTEILQGFSTVSLPADLSAMDWIVHPEPFVDKLTAHLWSTHQIGAFRDCAARLAKLSSNAFPEPRPPVQRLVVIVLDKDLASPGYSPFRKLRPLGTYFPNVDPAGAWTTIVELASSRAAKYPLDHGHWYIDGDTADPRMDPHITSVSWHALGPIRAAVVARMREVIDSGHGGPEELRTVLAELTPNELGAASPQSDQILARFNVSLFTEGSGTQIFSTTFVQWAARESLRRAQPCTLVMRYTLRQRQLPMNQLLSASADHNVTDPAGSLVDADMGAFYTWINQQRLSGADESALLVWSEGHNQAMLVGPTMSKNTSSPNAQTVGRLLKYLL